jgi:hypothetical protein
VLFVLGLGAGAVLPARSCGPDLPEAIFVSRQAPDDPKAFGSGELGLLLPSYYQRYLYLAYRALSGQALAGDELDAALELPPSSYGEDQPGYARWRAVRDSLGPRGRNRYVSLACAHQRGEAFYFYPNYYDDAFRSATATLLDRVRRQGSVDAAVSDWMRGQDAVFHACGYDSSPPPGPAPAGSPDWLAKDRAYQVAAWNFYSGRFDEAAEAFQAIGADRSSPWREWGAYLAARACTRKGTITPGLRAPNREALAEAERRLAAVLADRDLAARHESAQHLVAFVRLHLYPEKTLAEVSQALLQPHPGGDLAQHVVDLTSLLDRFTPAQTESLAKTNPDYELADWILTFQSLNETHALERWRATGREPWLVAAISAANDAPEDLMAAAAKLPADHAGFASVRFHRARLLAATGRDEDARRLLDEPPRGAISTANASLALRMRLARNFDEFVKYAARVPSSITGYDSNGKIPQPAGALLERNAAYTLNRWAPTSSIARAAECKTSDLTACAPIRIATWTRAVVLGDDSTASKICDWLTGSVPALAPYVRAYRTAPDADARRFEATWLLLHAPGMTPWVRWGAGRAAPPDERDMFRDNWWPTESAKQRAWFMGEEDPTGREPEIWTNPPGWDRTLAEKIFSSAEREQADRELAALAKVGPGANFLCQQTLAWARSHPSDPRLAEALHLCVQATRYGYTDEATTSWSRRAFSLLHSRFPTSQWAVKTQYWY